MEHAHPAARELPVDLDELCIALESVMGELRWYFDRDSGRTLLVNREYDPVADEGPSRAEIESQPERFIPVPGLRTDELLEDMRAFIGTVGESTLRESLELTLLAPKPERRFKSVLGYVPDVRQRWFQFKRQRLESRARAWLSSIGVLLQPLHAPLRAL